MLALALSLVGIASTPARAADADDADYATPLAGKPYHTIFADREVDVDARDRGDLLAITLGAAAWYPKIGEDSFAPLAAFYVKEVRETWRLRATVSVFVNEVDGALPLDGGPLELLAHLENYTIPFAQKEIVDGKVVDESALEWGAFGGRIGLGLRFPVAPFEVDSDLRIQAFLALGYLYTARVHDTPKDEVLPPDTPVYALRFRVRYDALTRNLLELPHRGLALGLDAQMDDRDRWHDWGGGGVRFDGEQPKTSLWALAYAVGATRIPLLSDRHHLVAYVHGALASQRSLDRFSAFRSGGGPFPSETDDLYRHPYPGALFNQLEVRDFFIATFEYRLEVFFFLYLHARVTLAWADRPTVRDGELTSKWIHGQAVTLGATTGFLWSSSIYVEAAYDTAALRNGDPGGSLLVMWSKAF